MILAKLWQRYDGAATGRQMINKVPEVTIFFWIVKILCTTVGETAADFLNSSLHLGLTGTTVVMGSLLVVTLWFQFSANRYVPGIYWLAVVLISVVGTLITDNLTDNFGVSLVTTTIVFSTILALVFWGWFFSERTLSVHTIYTTRRESFYWLAILFTFALGTAAGDLVAERLQLGYALSAAMFGSLIAIVYLAHWRFKLNAVLAFWLAYILTRPLGASIGDLLSQPGDNGGLGLGTVLTTILFLSTILITVTYLAMSKKDAIAPVGLPLRDWLFTVSKRKMHQEIGESKPVVSPRVRVHKTIQPLPRVGYDTRRLGQTDLSNQFEESVPASSTAPWAEHAQ